MNNDNMLSQDEIDALLQGSDDDYESLEQENVDQLLTEEERDILGEIGNISFGSSATTLSTLLNQKVEITTPGISLIYHHDLAREFPYPCVALQVEYVNGLSGVNLFIISQKDATIIADLMLGGTGKDAAPELNDIQTSAVEEAMNQMMGTSATSMSKVFQKKVDISPPSLELLNIIEGEGTKVVPPEETLVKVAFKLKIGELMDSDIMQLMPLRVAKQMVGSLTHRDVARKNDSNEPIKVTEEKMAEEQKMMKDEKQYFDYEQDRSMNTEKQDTPYESRPSQTDVQQATFSEFEPSPIQKADTKNLDMLLDVPLDVTVELGRTRRSVREILTLSSGSIIELDKLAGEPVDILVNNKLVAQGEVVVIDENFGVRVTDIVSQRDRLNKLR
ncbi:flagellar motor switch phosphatase FliY [Priestia endophytica]|uniref:flagellar motor switch phosphatase FliY n=1 Tax=Priestia endophytica TaxID=135735 RepID=UPI00227DE1AD|nr:flagellar motor switch phosphatase FliY [Priestia endophytica]MCY8231846.1 flagellar motor switch phosphatase FliY [Priestia endophytica]